MDIDNSLLWKKVLGEIEIQVSRGKFISLFKPTSLLSFDANVATIACPSTMVKDLLQKRFFQLIKKTLDSHTGINTEIIFIPKIIAHEKKTILNKPSFWRSNREDSSPKTS